MVVNYIKSRNILIMKVWEKNEQKKIQQSQKKEYFTSIHFFNDYHNNRCNVENNKNRCAGWRINITENFAVKKVLCRHFG